MYHYKFYIVIILVYAHFCVLIGCVDEPVAPSERIIRGKLYPSGLLIATHLISVGDYPIVSTANDGSFEIPTSRNPYDLTITEYDPYFNSSRYILKYAGLTITRPQIVVDARYVIRLTQYPVACRFKIHYPKKQSLNSSTVCKFTSNADFTQERDFGLDSENDSVSIIINIPAGKTDISGKIYFLETTHNDSGFVYSYNKYGNKELTLHEGQNTPVVFNEEELIDPQEAAVPVSLNYDPKFRILNSSLALDINSGTKHHEIYFHTLPGKDYFIIPILPGNEFMVKLYIDYLNSIGEIGHDEITANIGDPLILNHIETIRQMLPVNYGYVTDSTIFEVSDIDGPAVYEYTVAGQPDYKYFTNKRTVKFSEFAARMFSPVPNRQYAWSVKKYSSYNSIDDFLADVYVFDSRDSYIEITGTQYFIMAP